MNREQLTFQIWSQKQPLRFKSWWWNQNDFRIVVLKDLIHTFLCVTLNQSPLETGIIEGDNPVDDSNVTQCFCDWEILCESGCLRMQPKVWGGKIHLKLNIGERPIAYKYREGKMQSTLKREWKGLELVMREAFEAPIRSFLCQNKNETHFWENSVLFFSCLVWLVILLWLLTKMKWQGKLCFLFWVDDQSINQKLTLNEKRMHFFINKWASISFFIDNEKLKGQFEK